MSANLLHFPKTALFAPRRSPSLKPKCDRQYLTEAEIESLMAAASKTRNPTRNRAIVWVAYRHGLRSIELVSLTWDAVDFNAQQLHVWRAKRGKVAIHPLKGRELRLLRELEREKQGRHIFNSERGAPLSRRGIRKIIAELGNMAKFAFRVHPHMLRHACGFSLASVGEDTRSIQDYLGHRNIAHTVRYTALNPKRFDRFWQGKE